MILLLFGVLLFLFLLLSLMLLPPVSPLLQASAFSPSSSMSLMLRPPVSPLVGSPAFSSSSSCPYRRCLLLFLLFLWVRLFPVPPQVINAASSCSFSSSDSCFSLLLSLDLQHFLLFPFCSVLPATFLIFSESAFSCAASSSELCFLLLPTLSPSLPYL